VDKLKRVSVEYRDNFAAYLDGELEPDEVKNLEKVLADSPVARKDVELLVRTYDMLDLLPRPQATVEFTQKTMATIKLSDFKPDITQTAWYKRLHLGIVAAAATALLAVTGLLAYAGTSRWAPTDEDLLLRDLQVIKNLDEYSQVGQYDFLERLQGQPILMQEITEEVRSTRGR
jgi:hypothetical protein